jgi:hypothetical protein
MNVGLDCNIHRPNLQREISGAGFEVFKAVAS